MMGEPSPATWEERIRAAWDSCSLSPLIVLEDFEPDTPDEWDSLEIRQWLAGKRYDEIPDSSEIDSNMPFYYLTKEACSYFLGGYLLDVSRVLDRGSRAGFAVIHLSSFVRGERFSEVIPELSEDQRSVLFGFLLAMIGNVEAFQLDEKEVAGLASGAGLL